MIRRLALLPALLAAALLPALGAPSPAAALSCSPCPAVTTDAVNLRAAPSLDAEILMVIPAGADLEWDNMVPRENGYVAVSYAGVDGYAHGLYLLLFPAFASPTDWLNLRTEPNLDASVKEVMPPGADLMVLGTAANGFYSVWFEQSIGGYAHGDYLRFDSRNAFADGDHVVVRTDALNMRSRGGLAYAVEAVLFDGTQVTVTGGPVQRDNYTWYRVDAGAIGEGWVAGEFLTRL